MNYKSKSKKRGRKVWKNSEVRQSYKVGRLSFNFGERHSQRDADEEGDYKLIYLILIAFDVIL